MGKWILKIYKVPEMLKKCTTDRINTFLLKKKKWIQNAYPYMCRTHRMKCEVMILKKTLAYLLLLLFSTVLSTQNMPLLTKTKQKYEYYIHWIIIYNNATHSLVLSADSIRINKRHCNKTKIKNTLYFMNRG